MGNSIIFYNDEVNNIDDQDDDDIKDEDDKFHPTNPFLNRQLANNIKEG